MRQLSNSEIQDIITRYQNGESNCKLRKNYKLQFEDIRNLLIENGVTPRTHRESRLTYHWNENYFNQIDTSDKAYWLGFIYADGFITKKTNGNPVFGLTLAEREPLDKLNQCLESNKPIGYYKKKGSYSEDSYEYKLAFHSTQMVADLEKWGCIENKTFKLRFPDFLSEDLIPHFIRGYFDGDGSVFIHKQKVNNIEYWNLGVDFSGIYSFLKEIQKKLNLEKCLYKDVRKQTDCYQLKLLSNIRCLQLYHYMYHNAGNMCLSRKRKKFENFIIDRGSTTTISNPTNNPRTRAYLELCYLED